MKRHQLTPADLAHEHASLIAQLTLQSTWPLEALEFFRDLLTKCSPTRILAALDWVLTELVDEGYSPGFPAGDAAHSLLLLEQGLRRLERLNRSAPAPDAFLPLQAAA